MNACVSCLTWAVAIPVLFVAAFVLGPWLLVVVAVTALIAFLVMARDDATTRRSEHQRECGQAWQPPCDDCAHRCCMRSRRW